MFVILLSNRVHAARARRPAKVIADVRADLSDAAALAVMDYADGPMAMPAVFRADRATGWNGRERPARVRHASSRSARSRTGRASSSKVRKSSGKASASKSRSAKSSSAKKTSSKATAKKSSTRKKSR